MSMSNRIFLDSSVLVEKADFEHACLGENIQLIQNDKTCIVQLRKIKGKTN
jgi:hypothetical protein